MRYVIIQSTNSGGWDVDYPNVYGPFETRDEAEEAIKTAHLKGSYVVSVEPVPIYCEPEM